MLQKVIASIAGAAMLLAPGIEANARTPWTLLSDYNSSRQWVANVKTVVGEPHHRVYDHRYISNTSNQTSHRYYDCLLGRSWWWSQATQSWVLLRQYLPGTFGETEFKYVCAGY